MSRPRAPISPFFYLLTISYFAFLWDEIFYRLRSVMNLDTYNIQISAFLLAVAFEAVPAAHVLLAIVCAASEPAAPVGGVSADCNVADGKRAIK